MWVDKDISDIRGWLKKNRVSPLMLGRAASRNPYIVRRIMANKATLRSLRRVVGFIKKNPRGLR